MAPVPVQEEEVPGQLQMPVGRAGPEAGGQAWDSWEEGSYERLRSPDHLPLIQILSLPCPLPEGSLPCLQCPTLKDSWVLRRTHPQG